MNNQANQAHDPFDNRSDVFSNEEEINNEKDEKEKKGVKNPKWTRIMSMDGYLKDSLASYRLEDDLERDRLDYNSEDAISSDDEHCLFDPQ
jgi:hypothetical protein